VDASATAFDQAVPIQDGVHGADGRTVHLGVLPAQPLANLGSTPAGVLLLELHDELLDLEGQLSGMTVRPAGAIRQAIQPAVLVAIEDLVSGLAGDIELPAQHRHLLPVQQSGHKPKALVHLVTLPPWHLRTPRKCQKCHLCLRNKLSPIDQEGHHSPFSALSDIWVLVSSNLGVKLGVSLATLVNRIRGFPMASRLFASRREKSKRSRPGRGAPAAGERWRHVVAYRALS